MKELEMLSFTGNTAVVKRTDRSYPGVLIQGETLRIMLDDISELQGELNASNLEEVKEIANTLELKLVEILTFYEKNLMQHGFSLPYTNPVIPPEHNC